MLTLQEVESSLTVVGQLVAPAATSNASWRRIPTKEKGTPRDKERTAWLSARIDAGRKANQSGT